MSSNIRINRVCEYCGLEFQAKTTVTRFCSHKCNSRACKHKIKQLKIGASEVETRAVKLKSSIDVRDMEVLTVTDAARLLRCARQTIYNMINNKIIDAVNLGVQQTRIRREQIDKLFDQPEIVPLISKKKSIPLKIKDCYSIGEAERITGLSSAALYHAIKRNNISKFQQGKFVYVLKADLHKLANVPLKPTIS